MNSYWDSSALVECAANESLRNRLKLEGRITRSHTLSEVFSALTGGKLALCVDANEAAEFVQALSEDLQFVDLTPAEMLAALRIAQSKGVRGGRVHDFLHMIAAEKSGCAELLTADQNDFNRLSQKVIVRQL